MKVIRQLNIKDKEANFFTNILNVNNFDPNLFMLIKQQLIIILLFMMLNMSKT